MSSLRRIGFLAVLMLAGLLALVAACGGGGDDGDDGDAGDDEPTEQVTATPLDGDGNDNGDGSDGQDGEAFEEVYPVNETFWHQGFRIEVIDAIFAGTEPDVLGERDITLTLNVTFANEGPQESFLDSSLTLVTPGNAYDALFGNNPSVPAGGDISVDGAFVFRVEEDFDISDAYLLVGDGDVQQAQVPLGPGGGELVALEPVDAPVAGTLSTSLIDIEITGAEIRADYLESHTEVEAGKLALTLHFDATSRRSGNWSIFANEFALVLPDGAAVATDGADLPGLAGTDAGTVTQDLFLRFLVNDPPEGSYTLRFTPSDRFIEEGEPAEVTLDFEL